MPPLASALVRLGLLHAKQQRDKPRKIHPMFNDRSFLPLPCHLQVARFPMNHLLSLSGGFLLWSLWLKGYRALALQEHPLCVFFEKGAQHEPLGTNSAKYFYRRAEHFVCWRSDTTDDTSALPGVAGGGVDVTDSSPFGSSEPIIVGPVCLLPEVSFNVASG